MNDIESKIDEFKEHSDSYFKLLMENYPKQSGADWEDAGLFGSQELYERTIEAQMMLARLGETAVSRMMYIGFDFLYPSHNPVDWYDWREKILTRKVPTSIFLSIGLRIDSEFKRMSLHAQGGCWEAYCLLSESEFSVSEERYRVYFSDAPAYDAAEEARDDVRSKSSEETPREETAPSVVIEKAFFNDNFAHRKVDHIDRMEKHVSIWSNTLSIAARVLGIK